MYICLNENTVQYGVYDNSDCSGNAVSDIISFKRNDIYNNYDITQIYCDSIRISNSCPVWYQTNHYNSSDTSCSGNIIGTDNEGLLSGYCYTHSDNLSFEVDCENEGFNVWEDNNCNGFPDVSMTLNYPNNHAKCESQLFNYGISTYNCELKSNSNILFIGIITNLFIIIGIINNL